MFNIILNSRNDESGKKDEFISFEMSTNELI